MNRRDPTDRLESLTGDSASHGEGRCLSSQRNTVDTVYVNVTKPRSMCLKPDLPSVKIESLTRSLYTKRRCFTEGIQTRLKGAKRKDTSSNSTGSPSSYHEDRIWSVGNRYPGTFSTKGKPPELPTFVF